METNWFQCRLCPARTKFVKDCIAPHLKMSHYMDIEDYERNIMQVNKIPKIWKLIYELQQFTISLFFCFASDYVLWGHSQSTSPTLRGGGGSPKGDLRWHEGRRGSSKSDITSKCQKNAWFFKGWIHRGELSIKIPIVPRIVFKKSTILSILWRKNMINKGGGGSAKSDIIL